MTVHCIVIKDYAEMRDLTEEDPTEVEAGEYHLNYVKLDGNVGCMVKWCRSCDGDNGYHQTCRWRTCKLS